MELSALVREINLDGADRVLPFPNALPGFRGDRGSLRKLGAIEREQRLATLAVVRYGCASAAGIECRREAFR